MPLKLDVNKGRSKRQRDVDQQDRFLGWYGKENEKGTTTTTTSEKKNVEDWDIHLFYVYDATTHTYMWDTMWSLYLHGRII